MTMLEKVAAAILSAMESEADETMYACGVMSDRVIATIARAAVKAALHEAADAKDDSGHSLFLFSQRQRLKALAD